VKRIDLEKRESDAPDATKRIVFLFSCLLILILLGSIPIAAPVCAQSNLDSQINAYAKIMENRRSPIGERDNAIRELIKIGPPAVPIFIDLLNDKEYEVHYLGEKALIQIGPPAIQALAENIKRRSSINAFGAGERALGEIGLPALPALGELVNDPDPKIRSLALGAIGIIGLQARELQPAIERALKDEDKTVRFAALGAWNQVCADREKFKTVMIELIRDLEYKFSYRPEIFNQNLADQLAPYLIAVYQSSKNSSKRMDCLTLLSFCSANTEGVFATLLGALKDDDEDVREWGCWIIRDYQERAPEIVPVLIKNIHQPRAGDTAIMVLGLFGQRAAPAIAPLEKTLKSDHARGRLNIIQALLKIQPANRLAARELLKLLRSQDDVDWRYAALQDLGKIAAVNRRFIPPLIRATTDPNPEVRAMAVSELDELPPTDSRVVQALIRALKDQDHKVCAEALEVLEGFAVHQGSAIHPAIPSTIDCLKSDDRNVRREAAMALGVIGPAAYAAVPTLQTIQNNDYWDVQENVHWALERIEGKR